jgi:hypothetical protein
LRDEGGIAPGEEAVLCRGEWRVPDDLLHVVQWGKLWERYLAHDFANVEQAGERLFLLDEVVVTTLARGIVGAGSDEGIGSAGGGEASVDEAEPGILGDEHKVEFGRIEVRELDGNEAGLLVSLGPYQDGIIITKIIEERQGEGFVVLLDVVTKLLGLVAVSDGDEKLRGRGEELSCAIEDAESKSAGVGHRAIFVRPDYRSILRRRLVWSFCEIELAELRSFLEAI